VKPDGTARSSGSGFGAVVAAAQGRETANGLSASQAQLLSRFATALQEDRRRQQQQQQLSENWLSQQQQLPARPLSQVRVRVRV